MLTNLCDFAARCGFSDQATSALRQSADKLLACGAQPLFSKYREALFSGGSPWADLTQLADQTGLHPFTVHLLFMIDCTPHTKTLYDQAGLPESLYWDSMKDIRCKMEETYRVYGVWGHYSTFMELFLKLQCFCLGRLQFEITPSLGSDSLDGHSIHTGDPVINVHIPSFGRLDHADVLEAYRRAAEFFADRFPDGACWFHCETWMLDPGVLALLPEGNIRKFASDYHIVKSFVDPLQDDRYRIFNLPPDVPIEEYPEENTMQRNLKKWLLEGNTMGVGVGLFLWKDGKIVPHGTEAV